MSKTIDQRVVEMRFDNQHFEKNVQTSMSTLERLKQSLNLSGASKGLENLNAAAKGVTVDHLGAAAERVGVKFSAMQVAGITAITNLTNKAIDSAERIVKAFTIDPVKTGFSEYELKMGSIQTIMASTGATLEEVNGYLNELNEYSDKTIYSFQDMTSNIGKFTNAGVKLEDAVLAIKGISNEAALSGANANEASRAMYNFAQALSAGYVKLIDWKSIENANMATVQFKEQLIATALEMGTLTKTTDGMYKTLDGNLLNATKNFNETLQDQWMTSDVLIKTLKKYADETTEIGGKATQAATEVKTFTQMLDTLKESAQSGWAQSWEIIIGNFTEAKTLWTTVNNVLGSMIDKMSDVRNSFLKTALSSKWEQLNDKIQAAGLSTEEYVKIVEELVGKNEVGKLVEEYGSLKNAIEKGKVPAKTLTKALSKLLGVTDDNTKSMEDYSKVVKKVLNGDFGVGAERVKKLTEAGYDYAKIQNLVNEALGSSVRHTETLTESQKKNADALADLSDKQLKEKGYTEEQIKALRELKKAADEGGTSINELIKDMERPSGRQLIFEAFSNFAKEFSKLTQGIKDAWNEVFGDIDVGEAIYGFIETLHDVSEAFTISAEKATSFRTIMQGIFAGLNLTTTIFSKSLVASIKLLDAVLSLFGTDILGAAEYVASLVIKLRDWAYENTFIGDSINKIAKVIHAFIKGIYDCIQAFIDFAKKSKILGLIRERLSEIFSFEFGEFNVDGLIETINNFFETLANNIGQGKFLECGKNIVEGLIDGILEAIPNIGRAISKLANTLIDTFCTLLGIHSPSRVFMALGGFVILGLVKGIMDGEPFLLDAFKDLFSNSFDIIGELIEGGIPYLASLFKSVGKALLSALQSIGTIDFGSLFIMGSVVGLGVLANKMIKVLDKFATPFETIGKLVGSVNSVFSQTADAIERFSKAQVWKIRSEALLNLAKAMAVLCASLIGIAVAAEHYDLWNAVAVIGALSAILVALSWAMNKMSGASVEINKNGAKIGGFKTGLLTMAASLLILALIVRLVGNIENPEAAKQGFIGLIVLAGVMAGLFAAYGKLVQGSAAENINKAGRMMLGLSVALLLMVGAAKLISGMTWPEMGKAAAGILGFVGIVAALNLIAMLPSKGIGKTMMRISGAFLILAGVAKIINTMSWGEMGKAAVGLLGLVGIVALLMTISMIPGKNLDQIGKTLAGIGAAMLMLALTGKIIASMEWPEMGKAAVGLLGLSAIIGILIGIVRLVGKDSPKIATTLLAISVAMAILAGVAVVLSMVDVEGMQNGLKAMACLTLMLSLMIAATYLAKDCNKNLMMMSIAIGVMVAAVAALSMIKPEKLTPAVAAMSTLMAVFGIMVALASNVKSSIGTLAVLTAAVAIIGIVVYKLAELPVESVIGTAGSLSVLLLSMAASFKIISTVGPMATSSLVALAAMLGAVAILALILGALTALDCAPSMETAMALSTLLLAMSAVCIILAGLGSVSALAIAGAATFDAVILIIGGMLVAIGALMEYVPKTEEFLNKGIEVLKKIGTGLGEAIASIITGFLGEIIDSLPGFGEKLTKFMQNLQGFIDGVSGIGSDFITGMTNLSDGLAAISIISIGKLVDLAHEISDYSAESSGIDIGAINKISQAVKILADTIESLVGLDISGAKDLKKAVKELKKITLDELTNIFENAKPEFKSVGKDITNALAEGIGDKTKAISKAMKTVVKEASDAASKLKDDFEAVGKDLGSGLVVGIDAKQSAVYWAGYRLGQKAVQGEKDGQQSNSPSKATIKAGKWLGEGLIVGMKNISTKVYRAGNSLGSEAADSMTSVVAKMSEAINTDIDAQPTIRPVLDLSGVQASAKSLDGMFGNANIGTVSTMMSRRNQNGGNDDVVSAIDKLGKKLGDMSNKTYNINGVSANGDSEIENAIQVLVRAALVEGRV